MSRFRILDTPLDGLKVIERQQLGDERGFLSRIFCMDDLAAAGWSKPVVQINHTYTSTRGTVRGLHYQLPPHAEMKLVTCIRGRIWDVAVDLRSRSSTILRWYAQELSSDNNQAMLIPEGFAHGFQALTDDVELLYCHSAAYRADAEAGFNVEDPALSITWPLPIGVVSERDAKHPLIEENYAGLLL